MPENVLLVQVGLQALTSLAIAGGLLYAAIQFRHTRKAQLVANFSKFVELQYSASTGESQVTPTPSRIRAATGAAVEHDDVRDYFG